MTSAAGFGGGLVPGSSPSDNQFVNGTAATDIDDMFIYNTGTGTLFYDVDGTGATAQVDLAILVGNPIISNTDIFIIT